MTAKHKARTGSGQTKVQLEAELKRLAAERDETLAQQQATAEVLGVINSSPGDLAKVFDAILEKAHLFCGAVDGTLFLLDGERMRAVAIRGGVPEAFVERLKEGFVAADVPMSAALLAGEPFVHVDDLALVDHPLARAGVEVSKTRTLLVVPLRKGETLLGMIAGARKQVSPFAPKEIALLQSFAAQAVIAMENARLITETREALEQQTATAEVLQVINSSPGDLTPVFEAMLEKAMRLCEASFGGLQTYDGEKFRAVATYKLPEAFAELLRQPSAPAPDSAMMRLVRGERIVHIPDMAARLADAPENRIRRAGVELAGARTVLFVPLRKDSVLLGYITAFRQEVRPFTEKQIALLENFAAQAVIAMENARLITETREALEQQTATAEVLQVINSSPGNLAPVFGAMLGKAASLCEAVGAMLTTWDGERLHRTASWGMPPEFMETMQGSVTPPPGSPGDRLIRGENVVCISDLAEIEADRRPAVFQTLLHFGVRSYVGVALRRDDKFLGTINVYRRELRPFSDKQIALLQNFAAQAVVAMENARLLGELRQRTDEVAQLNRGLEARVAEQVDELGRVGRLKRFLAPQLAELIVSQGDENILESHRREIVVVFCDLRGYTAFTEAAEPEEVLDFLREYHGALGPLVSQFEGTLDQFSGDGIMVFFNDPMPIPDPAVRAVNMAVAMRDAAGTLIAAWRERGRELGFGAGIAQGYATLGQIGFSERSGYTAIGTVCNVAARLCAEAKDGQILLGQRVNVALKGSVGTEQVGALALKGLTQPIIAYNVPLAATQPALRVIEGGGPPQSV